MLKSLREKLTQRLWHDYRQRSSDSQLIMQALLQKGENDIFLDHFAVIDLPSPHSGIPVLRQLFERLGYQVRGQDYLASKQNDFTWLAEKECTTLRAQDVLPQIVAADFRLEEMPLAVRNIIEKYARLTKPIDWNWLDAQLAQVAQHNNEAEHAILTYLQQYFTGRDWPLPTQDEFHTVHQCNELLAWVLIFGRRPNHFTISAHLLNTFANLEAFNDFLEQDLRLKLNADGGKIKGNRSIGISQSATVERRETISLVDGQINLPATFVEFVWRHALVDKPTNWNDYFTHFVPQQADKIIQSLYVGNEHVATALTFFDGSEYDT